MIADADELHVPPVTVRPRRPPVEPVDLDDVQALRRAIAMHKAGKAVFTVPFNAEGHGTLTWLDPHDAERGPEVPA